ncbi:MAG TPA: glycosyltransferase family 39 protein [Candidatus Limnocylindria bacterium]|jgi:membrane-associated phospholipid phosphatase|nr:glycosyltransferase family 39 protein [Candidatus Limnocylindria bacterium]
MQWLIDADYSLFRLINQGMVSRVGDAIIPLFSGNAFFFPLVGVLFVYLLWKGGGRGRSYVLTLLLSIAVGELVLTNQFKKAVGRPRPFVTHPETRVIPGRTDSFSMPSGHAALWGAIATVTIMHYRRSWRFMVPLAFGVGFSRCYVGVHYPSDVLTGWTFGTLYGWGGVKMWNAVWRTAGRALFPVWWAECPVLPPSEIPGPPPPPAPQEQVELQWRRLTYFTIGLLFAARLILLKFGSLELSEDEAYQWLWSKHLALSYYSKPPFIAYAQWIGTELFGDNELGVRFLSPFLVALMSLGIVRFLAPYTDWRTAFFTVLVFSATPLLAVGSILITVDPLTVFFWVAAMLAGWNAIQKDSTRWWIVTGFALAGGFFSKYFSPFQWLSFAVFFALSPPARKQLSRPGPGIALAINLLACIPVVLWNAEHGWITLTHLEQRGGLTEAWHFRLNFLTDFLAVVPALLNPFFFIAALWACIAMWRQDGAARNVTLYPEGTLLRYLFAQGAPVFLFYLCYTLRARVQPNWICTAVIPLFLAGIIFWHRRIVDGFQAPRVLLGLGLGIGLPLVIVTHNTSLVTKITQYTIPVKYDPTHRVRGYKAMAEVLSKQRTDLLGEGKPVFIIAHHYGLAGLMNFYMAEAHDHVAERPVVTVVSSDVPENQFWFWPEYRYANRHGENALFVHYLDQGGEFLPRVKTEFESVTDLGTFEVPYRGQIYHRLKIYACRNRL